MEVIEIHTQAENGHVSFDLPAGHEALVNARLRVLVAAEDSLPASSKPVGTTDWAALEAIMTEVVKLNPYRDITDPVQWQRELRANDEKHYDR